MGHIGMGQRLLFCFMIDTIVQFSFNFKINFIYFITVYKYKVEIVFSINIQVYLQIKNIIHYKLGLHTKDIVINNTSKQLTKKEKKFQKLTTTD